jgi:short subunit dehydrogenase-like uncharacterized protein
MITLFGATGYTGRLVAQALARLGLSFRLAGRSPEKLARLANSLPTSPPWLVADVARPGTLSALFQDTRVLINCVGPFTDLGEPVLARAALKGVHYLDTANELGYVYRVQSYDTLARRSGAAIVPACSFQVALADCAAAVLAQGFTPSVEWQPADQVSVVYALSGAGSSFASRRSAVRALATSWLGYREGRWSRTVPCRETRQVQLLDALCPALAFPSSEIVTVPSHVPVRHVTTWLTVSQSALFWAPALVPAFAWLARGPIGWLTLALASRVFPPPERGMRSQAPFGVKVEIDRGDASRALTLLGQGVYDVTAEIVAYAAGQLARSGYDRSGVLAPAVALDPQALLDRAVAQWGLSTTGAPGGEARDE